MVGHAESSKPSVNERLARARQEDLRRCRNLQAKLARAQDSSVHPAVLDLTPAPQPQAYASSSSRAGLMFLSSTEQAQKERDQRTRERQLKRQVAGPIPPESWRDDFDRLSIRRGIGSHLDRQRLQDPVSSAAAADEASDGLLRSKDRRSVISDEDRELRKRMRERQRTACAGLRHMYDPEEADGRGASNLSLRDLALCVIADAINCSSVEGASGKGKDGIEMPDMDRKQIKEVLGYLLEHMRHRMMALCGRNAATDWPLSDWTAQALIDLHKPSSVHSGEQAIDDAGEDWEASADSNLHTTNTLPSIGRDATTSLDLSFSTITPRTLTRMLSSTSFINPVSLRMLSLAGFNHSSITSTSTSLDSPTMHSLFSQLPNLEILSLASTSLPPIAHGSGETDHQRSAVFLRKLSRSMTKLKTLDLSFCGWLSADAILGVSWATKEKIAWPRLENLVLVGCQALADPRKQHVDDNVESAGAFSWKAAGTHVASWHSTHSQQAALEASRFIDDPAPAGILYDAYTDTLHRDPFDLFPGPTATVPRTQNRATFDDYVNNTIQPAIISHMIPTSAYGADGKEKGVLMEYVRCPRSSGKVEMWQWQRARVLEAVRGRTQLGSRQRGWVEVWF